MKKNITLLHTNDLHGSYDQLIRQAGYIKKRIKELEAQNEHYLLVDGGDHMDMSINECLATQGRIHLEMIQNLGYHAMSVGNNELLRSTPELIRSLSIESKVPWLLANLVEQDGTPIGGTKEYHIVEIGDNLKIGMVGTTDQYGDLYENKHEFLNRDTLDSVKSAVYQLKANGANLIIYLSHMGYDTDLELAKGLSGIVDVIVGAHSHTILEEPIVVSDVIIVQAGSHGRYVGELRLEYDITNRKIDTYNGKLIEISDELEVDLDMLSIVERGREQTRKFMSEVLCSFDHPLTHKEMITLMASGVQDYWNADIGVMYGGAALGGLEHGPITKGAIFDLCKSMHSPVLIELTGQQIEGLIIDSYKDEIISKKIYGNGFRPHGIAFGTLGFSGVTWEHKHGNIFNIKIHGKPLLRENIYRVGTGTPMLYEEVCGYPSVKGCKMLDIGKSVMIKDVFIEYLRSYKESIFV
ncbi:bifunctional metallophosphatase/5'-nucleotidase [Bacillus salitolerans]|uniref:Bifunctional metallophosphatase/5'-nucleotidase n=1 Tax=Bacillus salitolerans TaxID=1437434 RepID=A0ABW4LZC0_9BACI